MCGRFALNAPALAITEIFEIDILPDLVPRYNVAPSQRVTAVVVASGARTFTDLKWGLIPSWAKDARIGYRMLNARSETVASKPSFRQAFKRRRTLIAATGFYEWLRLDKKNKVPHLFSMADRRPFAMAGLCESWKNHETGEPIRSCTILTTTPNERVAPVHDRMPVILPTAHWDAWLDPEHDDTAALQDLLVPFPAERMAARRVSTHVNNARHEGPACQAPFEAQE